MGRLRVRQGSFVFFSLVFQVLAVTTVTKHGLG